MSVTDPSAAGWKLRELPGFIGSVGPLWTKKEDDVWAYAIVSKPEHTNPAGIVHLVCPPEADELAEAGAPFDHEDEP